MRSYFTFLQLRIGSLLCTLTFTYPSTTHFRIAIHQLIMGSTGEPESTYDAIIVGAGFAGIYQVYMLRNLGVKCLVIDAAGNVGGT
jgi:hypothetical protein